MSSQAYNKLDDKVTKKKENPCCQPDVDVPHGFYIMQLPAISFHSNHLLQQVRICLIMLEFGHYH